MATIFSGRGGRGLFLFLLLAAAQFGCNRSTPSPAPTAAAPTVASLVPAATDLIVGMGAKEHLVAVSNFDQPRAETLNLPRVGDYRTVDWEKIAELKPAVMIVQFRPDKMPAGLEDRARDYGIRLVNIRIERLDDIFATLKQIGEAIGERPKAEQAAKTLQAELDAVRQRVAGLPKVPTLMSLTDNPLEAVGGGTFLDDLLSIAGGENVLGGPGASDNSYPTLDRERLLGLNPHASLNLLPGASAQVQEKAHQFWASVPDVAAVKAGRVHYLTQDYLLWPGLNVGKIAERFAEVLHPSDGASKSPSTHLTASQLCAPRGGVHTSPWVSLEQGPRPVEYRRLSHPGLPSRRWRPWELL